MRDAEPAQKGRRPAGELFKIRGHRREGDGKRLRERLKQEADQPRPASWQKPSARLLPFLAMLTAGLAKATSRRQ